VILTYIFLLRDLSSLSVTIRLNEIAFWDCSSYIQKIHVQVISTLASANQAHMKTLLDIRMSVFEDSTPMNISWNLDYFIHLVCLLFYDTLKQTTSCE
jgi:hypothetical protein